MKTKTATFGEGVIFSLVISFISSVLLFALSSFFSANILIRLLISGVTLVYILYLLSRSKERSGRIIMITVFLISMTSLWLVWPALTFFIMGHLISIWLVRSLYFYSSLISSLVDLTLNGFSVTLAFLVSIHTNSPFLSLWCFFLSQALFVMIPKSITKSKLNKESYFNNEDTFQRAYLIAESAVRQLYSNNK